MKTIALILAILAGCESVEEPAETPPPPVEAPAKLAPAIKDVRPAELAPAIKDVRPVVDIGEAAMIQNTTTTRPPLPGNGWVAEGELFRTDLDEAGDHAWVGPECVPSEVGTWASCISFNFDEDFALVMDENGKVFARVPYEYVSEATAQ